MPELPEVETMRRQIMASVGGTIMQVTVPRSTYRPISMSPCLRSMRRRITGQTIRAVDRIAKRVLIRLDNGFALVFQPKMAGLVLTGTPPSVAHVRFRLSIKNAPLCEIIYWDRRGLGSIHLWDSVQEETHLGEKSLGPDALRISLLDFQRRLMQSKREIKISLLDQKILAGVGNLYAAEILHRAGIHPQSRCPDIDQPGYRRMYQCMLNILNKAIEEEGSTLSDGTYAKAQNDPGNYQNHHRVYDRANQPCQTCGIGIVQRIVQAQRSTYFCPACQLLPAGINPAN